MSEEAHKESLDLVSRAAAELHLANTTFERAFLAWSEAVTALHIAEVAMHEAHKRTRRADAFLKTSLNGEYAERTKLEDEEHKEREKDE